MGSVRLLTVYPDGLFGKIHRRWHRVEAIKLVRDEQTGYYRLYVTEDLARSVHAEAGALFDAMDRDAA